MRERLTTAGEIAGAGFIVLGLTDISRAAATIATGVFLIVGCILWARK